MYELCATSGGCTVHWNHERQELLVGVRVLGLLHSKGHVRSMPALAAGGEVLRKWRDSLGSKQPGTMHGVVVPRAATQLVRMQRRFGHRLQVRVKEA